MTENTPTPGPPRDEPLDEATQRTLAAMMRDTPPTDPQTRRLHLDAAMAEFDAIHGATDSAPTADPTVETAPFNGSSTAGAPVISLTKAREARQLRTKMLGAAAAVAIVVGIGVTFAKNDPSFGGTDDMAGSAASEAGSDSSTSSSDSSGDAEFGADLDDPRSDGDANRAEPSASAPLAQAPPSVDGSRTPPDDSAGATDEGDIAATEADPESPATAELPPLNSAEELAAFSLSQSEKVGANIQQRIATWHERRAGHLRP